MRCESRGQKSKGNILTIDVVNNKVLFLERKNRIDTFNMYKYKYRREKAENVSPYSVERNRPEKNLTEN